MSHTCQMNVDGNVRELFRHVTAHDHVAPLSDGVLDALAQGASGTGASGAESHAPISLGLVVDDQLAGFGAVVDQGERGALEMCVAPEFRGRGGGRLLAEDLLERAREAGVASRTWAWAHGDHPAASALAQSFGFARERVLLQLSTKTLEEGLAVPEVNAPEGVEIRTYQPGDEVRWREINNAAFSWHPEQGNQSAQDYARIVEDPSFDPDSVFFAVHNGDIVGFHHTKIHTDHPSGLTMGEVYVIGVDPHVHSKGLGTALMNAGMRHLLDSGVDAIELYVESDNDAALHVYKKLGFVKEIRHISYAPRDHT